MTHDNLASTVIICDEVDSLIFGADEMVQASLQLFPRFKIMIGMTGSDLKEFHVRASVKLIQGAFVKMNVAEIYKPPPVCHGVEVFSKVSDFRDVIEALCIQQAAKTPVVIIGDDERNLLSKKLKRAGIPVEQLYSQSFTESNGALKFFGRKRGEKYPAYIINDS